MYTAQQVVDKLIYDIKISTAQIRHRWQELKISDVLWNVENLEHQKELLRAELKRSIEVEVDEDETMMNKMSIFHSSRMGDSRSDEGSYEVRSDDEHADNHVVNFKCS